MRFNDVTLMVLNVCAHAETQLLNSNLKTTLTSCLHMIDYLDHKYSGHELTPFLKNMFQHILRLAANKALDTAPETIRDKVNSLWPRQERFEEMLVTLGGESYREHFKHSKRNFWLGNLLSTIKSKWGLEKEPPNFGDCWYLIARFHDFCYILEKIKVLVEETEKAILEGFPNINFSMDVDVNLGGYAMEQKHLQLLEYINYVPSSSFVTKISLLEQLDKEKHSILSALFIIDFLRTRNMVPRHFKETQLREMARAIALHTDSLTQAELESEKDYFAALLIIVDEVQEWGRPRKERDHSTLEAIELNNLKIDFKNASEIQNFLDKILNGSGVHKLTQLKLGIRRRYANSLIIKKKNDELQISLQIRFGHGRKFLQQITQMNKTKKKTEIDALAKQRAKEIIRKLSSFGNQIGLEAVGLTADKIIASKNDRGITLEIPMLRKSKMFPINADRTLLSLVLAAILTTLSPYRSGNFPKIAYEDTDNQVIEFNIPHLKEKTISKKRRNLFRLSVFDWDWGIRIISRPTEKGEEKLIFPLESVDDLSD